MTLDEILRKHIAKHIIEDSDGAIAADILAWHEAEVQARCERYGEIVREALASEWSDEVGDSIRESDLPPVPREGAK